MDFSTDGAKEQQVSFYIWQIFQHVLSFHLRSWRDTQTEGRGPRRGDSERGSIITTT